MFFIVTGAGPPGAVSFTCQTTIAALEKALAVKNKGVADILIADSHGLQYAPADFHRLFIETNMASAGWRSMA
jgi:hypothetical protein